MPGTSSSAASGGLQFRRKKKKKKPKISLRMKIKPKAKTEEEAKREAEVLKSWKDCYEEQLRLLYDTFAYGTGAIGDELRSTKHAPLRPGHTTRRPCLLLILCSSPAVRTLDFEELYSLIERANYVDECVTWREVKQACVVGDRT